MQITARHAFAASPDRVHAMSLDPGFAEQACRDLGSTLVSTESVADGVRIVLDAPTDPAFRTFVGATMRVVQTLTWGPAAADGSRAGRVLITVQGLPVTVDAAASLAPAGAGSTVAYAGDLTVKVPLLGATLERQAEPFVRAALDAQQTSGNAWLASH